MKLRHSCAFFFCHSREGGNPVVYFFCLPPVYARLPKLGQPARDDSGRPGRAPARELSQSASGGWIPDQPASLREALLAG